MLHRGEEIDEDGIFHEDTTDATTYDNHTDAQRIQKHITIATAINVKRILRQMVLPRLNQLAENIATLTREVEALRQSAMRIRR